MNSQSQIRNHVRAQRTALNPADRAQLSISICRRAAAMRELRRSANVAIFLPIGGEVETRFLAGSLRRMGRRLHLPAVTRNEIEFRYWHPNVRLQTGCFGTLEPPSDLSEPTTPRELDLVFVPLVAIDDDGNRIGMGGGYYDRAFSFLRLRRLWRKPRLIGLCFDLQRVREVQANEWDIPLDAAVSESKITRFRHR
jgi:5-formyltetrahydrofolate cyclo-ligase